MKLSEITPDDAVSFVRIEGDDARSVTALIEAAKSFVLNYTGLTEEEADTKPDLAVAALVIVGDLYEHRDMTAETAAENRTVKTILGMYCRNLIEGE